jgi:cellulose biosynthesis protein BcsQ
LSFNPELCRNESEVESKLIVQYLLPKLGYAPDTWHQEVSFGNIRLDFLAFAVQVLPFKLDAKSPLSLVLEAKHPREKLDKHLYRLRHYLVSLNIPYGLLTNGKEIRIYRQNVGNIELLFSCAGKDLDRKFDEVYALIGRDRLQDSLSSILEPENFLEFTPSSSLSLSKMKTIAIYHNKGGVGKTTVAVNLAAALSKRGYRTLLIDLDSQANSTFATGLVKFQFEEEDDLRDRNVYHLLESGDFNFIPDIARKSQHFNNPEIDVIPSHITLIEGQDTLTRIAPARTRLMKKLEMVSNQYDMVIIDTPPSRDLYAQVALISADYLIIPSDLKPFANQGLPTVKNFIKEADEYREQIGRNKLKILGVLASKISTNAKFVQSTFPKQRAVIPSKYQFELLETVIYDRSALSTCMNHSVTVGELEYPDPKSVIKYADEFSSAAQVSAQEFELLVTEVLAKIEANS